jgi:predicted RNase H-like nuclease (RuvC/YqgF family)
MTDDFVKQLREKAFRAESCEMLEMAADRIEKLEAELHHCFHRIEELQAALRQIIQEDALTGKTVFVGDFGKIARKALEGKDDVD